MLKLVIRGKNIEVTPALKDYVTKKVTKLEKYSHHIVEIDFELHVEKNPRIANNKICDVNIYANGVVIRGEEANADMYAAIDLVIDKLDRQMKKYEEKRVRNRTGKLKMSEAIATDNQKLETIQESEDEEFSTY